MLLLFPVVCIGRHRHPTNRPFCRIRQYHIEHPSGALDVHLSNEGQDARRYAHLLFGRPEKYFPVKFISLKNFVVVIMTINKGILYEYTERTGY